MFYFETFRIILNPSSVKKNKATLGNDSNSKPQGFVTQEKTMLWRKRRQTQNQDSQPRQNRWKQMQGQKLCREY